jgi:hypothetical protein
MVAGEDASYAVVDDAPFRCAASFVQGLDAESWAGGIRQQFSVALPLVERVLGGLKQVGRLPLGRDESEAAANHLSHLFR